jgi:hypothetical protein
MRFARRHPEQDKGCEQSDEEADHDCAKAPTRKKIPASLATAGPRERERRDIDPPEDRGTGVERARNHRSNDRGMRDGQRCALPIPTCVIASRLR